METSKANWKKVWLTAVVATCLLLPGAAQTSKPPAVVQAVSGSLRVRRAGTKRFVPLAPGQPLRAGDVVRTGARSRAALRMSSGAQIQLTAKTVLQMLAPLSPVKTARLFREASKR